VKTLLQNATCQERVDCAKVELMLATEPLVGRSPIRNECDVSLRVALVVVILASFAAAQTLTGKVKNFTTGKPSAGDAVVLFKLGRGMEEVGRTLTDAGGQFSLKLEAPQAPHLVFAVHQGVIYHRMAPPGTTSVAIETYDVAKKVDGIKVVADVMRIQASHGQIVVTRDFGVRNTSHPPRTQMNDHNLEFYVPENARVLQKSATVASENDTPLRFAPVAEGEKNRYSFVFPLRPGLTRFEVAYQFPYNGIANLDPKSIYNLKHFVVMVPKGMQFHAVDGSAGFTLMSYPSDPNATVQVVSNTTSEQNLAFKISGEGPLDTGVQSGTQSSVERVQSSALGAPRTQSNIRSAGGLGPPIEAPEPLQKYRWWILGACAAVLLIGGVYIASRQERQAGISRGPTDSPCLGIPIQEETNHKGAAAGVLQGKRIQPTAKQMEEIKEALFQIEVGRKQGQISQAEYEKAKAALRQTLHRALQREAQKV
jgi:hypothetical protein